VLALTGSSPPPMPPSADWSYSAVGLNFLRAS
jgi:hypothetical protein